MSQELARYGAGAGLALAGIGHLTFVRESFRAQVPEWVPIDADDTKRLVRLFVEPLLWATALHAGGLLTRRTARR